MPTPRNPRAEQRRATAERVIDEAWKLCRAEGVGGWSMRQLATKVGMQAPSLYEHFASKNAIYDAMFAAGYRDYLAATTHLLDPALGTPQHRVRLSAHVFIKLCLEDPARFELLFTRPIPGFVPSEESFALAQDLLGRAALALSEAAPDLELDIWTAMLTGLASQQISNDPGGTRWVALVDRAVDLLLGGAAGSFGTASDQAL